MTPLHAATAVALATAAAGDERIVLVGEGASAGPLGTAIREAFAGRVVDVGGDVARPWVAAGLAVAGRRPVVLLPTGAAVPTAMAAAPRSPKASRSPQGARPPGSPKAPRSGGQVVVTDDIAVADALLGAGANVVQPAWPADVAPLLSAALAGDADIVVRVHDGAAGEPGDAVPAPVPGRPRVLRSGGHLTLVASGATVGLLSDVARMLAGRGASITAVEQHTFRPGRGVGLALYEGAIVIAGGDGDGALPDRVRRVPTTGTTREVMDAVVAAVPSLLAPRDGDDREPARRARGGGS